MNTYSDDESYWFWTSVLNNVKYERAKKMYNKSVRDINSKICAKCKHSEYPDSSTGFLCNFYGDDIETSGWLTCDNFIQKSAENG